MRENQWHGQKGSKIERVPSLISCKKIEVLSIINFQQSMKSFFDGAKKKNEMINHQCFLIHTIIYA